MQMGPGATGENAYPTAGLRGVQVNEHGSICLPVNILECAYHIESLWKCWNENIF